MKTIPLTKGYFAKVDNEDYEELAKVRWQVALDPRNSDGNPRARRTIYINSKNRPVLMHRVIMNAKAGQYIDHINRDALDNRKSNLRFCTLSQNQHNRGMSCNNKSGFKGVSWDKTKKKWRAQIEVNSKVLYLGLFNFKEEAALAYNEAAKKHFGKFALLNKLTHYL